MAGKDMGINAKFGLDGTGFQEGIGKINKQIKVIQAEFKEASSRVSDFGRSSERMELLTRQVEMQKQAVTTLQAAYEKSVISKGEDASATQSLQIKLLNAKTALNRMDSELKKANEDIKKQPSLWSKFGDSTKNVSEKAQSRILSFKNALLGLTATVAGGAGLFAFTQSAIEAGDATYRLSQRLHVSTKEAGQVSKILKITDTDSSAFSSTLIKLDKGIESAGKKGNTTTKALLEFGVKLTDAHGKLLPIPDQMERLAAAYKKAAENGNEEAFTAQVLGNKGQSLIPMLEDYTEAKQKASEIQGIGLDPKEAHEAEVALTQLKMQVGQLTGAFAKELVPIVRAVLPPIIQGFAKVTEVVKTHKVEIDAAVQSFIKLGQKILTDVTPVIKDIFNFISTHGNLVKNVVLGIGAAFAVFKTITTVINGVKFAMDAWKKVTKAMEIAQAALNIVLSMNPIGLVVIAIAALAAGLIYLFKHNKAFHDFVVNSWNIIKSTVLKAVNSISGFMHNLASGISSTIKNISNSITNGFKSAISYITSLPSKAMQWGKDFIQGLINGIKSAIGDLTKAVKGIADKIKSFLHFSVPDEGPLTDYEKWMPDFMGGLASGIKKSKGLVTEAVKGLSTNMSVGVRLSGMQVTKNTGSMHNNPNKPSNQVTINFNGSYSFNNKDDINHFMNQAALLVQRRKQ